MKGTEEAFVQGIKALNTGPKKLSDGSPSTLGTYLRMAKVIAPASKFEKLIKDKIAESPNGENEEVVAAESQMMYLLGQMLDPAEEET